jgi:hypothetical protein
MTTLPYSPVKITKYVVFTLNVHPVGSVIVNRAGLLNDGSGGIADPTTGEIDAVLAQEFDPEQGPRFGTH